MRCPEAFEALSARFDGELRATEIPLLQAHLGGCADCQAYERELAAVARRLRGAAVEQPPVPAALRARITRAITSPPPRRAPFVFGLAFLGAGVSLGALAMVARARPAAVSPTDLAQTIRIEGEGAAAATALDAADRDWENLGQQLGQKLDDNLAELRAQSGRLETGDAPAGDRFAPGTTLAAGNRIEARGRSIELALGSWGHLSLAPGGHLQIERAPGEMTLLAGRATISVASAPEPLRLHTAAGDVTMPEGQFEIRTRSGHSRANNETVDGTTAVPVVQVLALAGHAQLSSAGQQMWLDAGGRGWLRPDRPPLGQGQLGGAPSAPVLATAPAAVAATPSSPGNRAPSAAAVASANDARAAMRTALDNQPSVAQTPPANAAMAAAPAATGTSTGTSAVAAGDHDQPIGTGRLHGTVAFGAGDGDHRTTAARGPGCPAQPTLAYVRLDSPSALALTERSPAGTTTGLARPTGARTAPVIPALLDGCGLTPAAVALGVGQILELRNTTAATHRVDHGGDDTTVGPGETRQLHFTAPGRYNLLCDGDPTPCGQVTVDAAAVIATTDLHGAFTLDHIPAGPHEITAWRPDHGTATARIEIQPDTTTEVQLALPDDLPGAVAALPSGTGAEASPGGNFGGLVRARNNDRDCRLAHVNSPVGIACAKGGLKEAKKTMKGMVKVAKDRGKRFDCDSCHKNEEDWKLTPDGPTLFGQLLEAIRT